MNARYLDPNAFLDDGETGYTALLRASIAGNVEMVKLVLTRKPNVDYARKGKTALYYAAIEDHDEIVSLLKEAGAQENPEQIRLTHDLIRAACKGFKLRDGEGFAPYPGAITDDPRGPILREISETPLPADQFGDPSDIVNVIKKADINMPNPRGYTALMYAANLGLVENVKTLLANGADATLKSADGETALSLAEHEDPMFRHEERSQVVKILMEHLTNKQ